MRFELVPVASSPTVTTRSVHDGADHTAAERSSAARSVSGDRPAPGSADGRSSTARSAQSW